MRLGAGAGLLALAALTWILSAVLASNGNRAWESGRPPATVRVLAGHTYHLSSRSGPASAPLDAAGTPSPACFYATSGGVEQQLSIAATAMDPRILHNLGAFIAPESGAITVRCEGIAAVYVDDAVNAPFDWSGLFVLVSTVLALAGAVLVLSALIELDANRVV